MARKWFQLTGEDGSALTSATSVRVDVEDVDTFQDAKLPKSSSSVTGLGNDEVNALIVVVPDADDGDAGIPFLSLLQYFWPSSRSLEKTLKTKKDV
ncbi:hypothetical protein PF001_g15479 [Phytophthora fragariae]|uniref:Uncharacterized protein n=1 Tax=Phytophthora fragariae TaxID=53985 RepID=A0A6A4D2W7_9STRA|nr:hypothetical protein PF004_g15100 [Phytophthora fragariae]KAE9299358.1 hypothetical protein PF001_g15479 [Phytophthora fragariae]